MGHFTHNPALPSKEYTLQHQKFGLLTLALVATALLTTLALTVDAIAESKAQTSTQSSTRSQTQTQTRLEMVVQTLR
jgi:hypothetical protein